MKSTETLSVLKSVLGNKVVSYHPVFARALRSVPAAVMLSQGLFWQENASFRDVVDFDGGRPFFTKTAAEWYDATGVTDDAQVTARELLRESGFWFERRAGLPAKLYFHIDIKILVSVIYGYLENGIQLSIDHRSKNRKYTRSSSGKFRKQVAGNHGNIESVNYGNKQPETTAPIIRKESFESFESTSRDSDDGQKKSDFKKAKKAPPVPQAPPKLFAESAWYGTAESRQLIQEQFAQRLLTEHPHVEGADILYYWNRCEKWSRTRQARCLNWIDFAADIIESDRRQGKLITLKNPFNADENSSSPGQSGPGQSRIHPGFDLDKVAGAAWRVIERHSKKNGV